jgi:hypothetical protein
VHFPLNFFKLKMIPLQFTFRLSILIRAKFTPLIASG